MFSKTVAALLAFAAAASAVPSGSPICSVDNAAAIIAQSGMGANQEKIPCTFTADKTTYTPGSTITISWACEGIDNFQGFLAYASPQNKPDQRVGEFTLLDGLKGNKAICGDVAEKENSVVTHSKAGTFAPTGSITYTASATDHGTLEFSFIVMKKLSSGFRWAIGAKSIVVSAPGSAAQDNNYGTVAGADQYNCNCPAASTVSVIRKCTPKTTATTKVFITRTSTTTCTITSTSTETSTTTVTETVSPSCGAVAGGEETPTTTNGYGGGYGYGNGYGNVGGGESTPTTTSGYGGYGAYSADEDEDEDDDDE